MAEWVVLTDHAIGDARRRGTSEASVLEVATTPEQRITQRGTASRVIDPASGKLQLIRVVVDHGQDGDTVVTVYRTSKVRKYWRNQ
jgi:Domain of unknown function (DUF4258)